jgi:hypothetical protein
MPLRPADAYGYAKFRSATRFFAQAKIATKPFRYLFGMAGRSVSSRRMSTDL